MLPQLKSLWVRYWLRRSDFAGRYRDLQRLYATRDPWNLLSDQEQHRYAEVNAMIRSFAPGCRSLLELGCGEGFQTRRLLEVSEAVAGIDVSEKAIARARQYVPTAELQVGKAEDAARLFAGRQFDLVTACEVLYYSNDIARTIEDVQSLANRVLVTNYSGLANLMRSHFTGPGWSRLPDIVFGDTTWECYIWQRL